MSTHPANTETLSSVEPVFVPVEEYLHTPYDPDCDYVDGEVVERNLGEFDHADLQTSIAAYFRALRKKLGIYAVVEWRVQVAPTRFRVPDVLVMLRKPAGERILKTPPFIVIEILSSEDRLSRMQKRIDDYLAFGVPNVWLIDPETRRAWVCTADGNLEIKNGVLRTQNPAIELPLQEVFDTEVGRDAQR